MNTHSAVLVSLLALLGPPPAAALAQAAQAQAAAGTASSMDQVLAASPAGDWRTLDPANTLYLQLAKGRVIIELVPAFAPHHVANIKALVREGYFDGAAIVRVQDNYVVQWAAPEGRAVTGAAKATLAAEFTHSYDSDLPFTPLPDPDTYAPQTGFTDGFPAARDPATHQTWLTHCYGMVGAGRDNGADSGGGTELYAVIGNSPRQLDRNVTLVGRVVSGMEFLSALPRGTQALGFYATPAERVPIVSIRLAADIPAAKRTPLEALRTDSVTFAALLQNRRFRQDAWYKAPAGRLDVCNMPLPVRTVGGK
ncbi:MAG: peptidylprolyl isomerase [Pseudomonadota bacterium]|nr:peptidylprolyl isomerase [Pseudomonadota bacterium]